MERVTIYDIAEKLKVSPATVTRALNNLPKVGTEKRNLIIKTAEEMGYTPNRAATSLSRKQIRIESFIYGAVAEFYQDIIDGINVAYEELKDFNLKVNMHVMDKSNCDEDMLCECLASIKQTETSAVLIYSVSDTEIIARALDRLILAEIPVMVVNSDVSTVRPHYDVRPDGEMAGRMAAEILDWVTSGKNICFFMGDRDTGILRHNNFGFLKEAEERKLNIAARFYDNGDAEKALQYFEEFIATDSQNTGGIYINSAVSNSICRGLFERGLLQKYRIVASDLGKDIVEYISNGQMDATIFQNPFKQGYESLMRLYAVMSGFKDVELAKQVKPVIICKSNVEYYAQYAKNNSL
ncbi:MAG: LacI family transcriptional regulator [Oscillospiraceae bacterium]|nr:LacI family transcriptional regulator [Oscillospiraceae bacterium]MCL2278386.1 LacI family transcriptional regulator [Oscillospiraceae bacterium]